MPKGGSLGMQCGWWQHAYSGLHDKYSDCLTLAGHVQPVQCIGSQRGSLQRQFDEVRCYGDFGSGAVDRAMAGCSMGKPWCAVPACSS